jgi:nucleolar pre-ribosomal-associated protein 1
MYLLLGEVCETVQEQGFETTTPSVIAEVACLMITILADPSHKMYGKINKFLNKAPSWEAQKVISYWIDRILLKEPEDDDGHDIEVNWLLELLVNALRTSEVSSIAQI